jgi:hypothetical protein
MSPKDTLAYAEKTTLGVGQAELRTLVTDVTGLAGNLPKTCGTWCGKRRPLARTSKIPEHVTCEPCRTAAAADHDFWAEAGEALIGHARAGNVQAGPAERSQLAEEAHHHRVMADRYRGKHQPPQASSHHHRWRR